MNENFVERFGRCRLGIQPEIQGAHVWIRPQRLNPKVRQYFEDGKTAIDGGQWLRRPEIPTSDEVMDTDTDRSSSSDVVEIVPNKLEGAWESKGEC